MSSMPGILHSRRWSWNNYVSWGVWRCARYGHRVCLKTRALFSSRIFANNTRLQRSPPELPHRPQRISTLPHHAQFGEVSLHDVDINDRDVAHPRYAIRIEVVLHDAAVMDVDLVLRRSRRNRRNRFAGLYCEVRDFEQPVFGLCACASEAMANGTVKHVSVFFILDSFILWMSLI